MGCGNTNIHSNIQCGSISINGLAYDNPCEINPLEAIVMRIGPEKYGYPAIPLAGVWSTAPYLHNGSVPTLYHLLAKEGNKSLRPGQFLVGQMDYDQAKVGYLWDPQQIVATDSHNDKYDASVDGFNNRGHEALNDSGMYVDQYGGSYKLSWDVKNLAEKEALKALLEYMKTL